MTLHPSRRAVISGAAIAAAAAAAPSLNISLPLRGIVFQDRSGRSVSAPEGKGIEGVLVSNGREVVATDSEGRWVLPWRPGQGVFVIKPQGWGFPLEMPGFRQCWRPNVTPDDAIAFGLVPMDEAATFDVALLADTQPQTDLELDYLRDAVLDDVAQSGAAFAINHGDVVFDDHSLYDRYLRLAAGTGVPWHHCPGNHDMNAIDDATSDRFALWKQKIGPTNYAFEHGLATFILLNNVAPLPRGELTSTGYDYCGRIGQDQLTFVRNLLARTPRNKLIVVSMHIPLVGAESPGDPAGHTEDRQALLDLLVDRPTVSFAGHTHTTEHHYLPMPRSALKHHHHHHVLTAASGSWWSGPFDHRGVPIARSRDGNPRGFHLLPIEGNRYTTRFIANAETKVQPGQFALCEWRAGERSLLSEGRLVADRRQLDATELVFNLHDGGPRSKVKVHLAQRGRAGLPIEVDMNRVSIRCPSTTQHFDRYRNVLKSWVEACVSTHVWTASLPTSLAAGVYTAIASVVDEYGRNRTSSALIEIVQT